MAICNGALLDVERALQGTGAAGLVDTPRALCGFTPLMLASFVGDVGKVQLLLESGAKHGARRTKHGGYTALHDAAAQGRLTAVSGA